MSLEINNLQVSRDKTIFKDLNLKIKNNQFCVVVGPSGCGKSTLLQAISGLIDVDQGDVIFNQKNITKMKLQDRSIGYVFQDYALYPNMNVYKNIEFGLKILKVPPKERKQRVNEMITKLSLNNFTSTLPISLSGGQKQRVAIGRALIINPQLLLMDEPLSSLDASLRINLRSFIKKIHLDNKLTTIFVTHDQEEALALADTIVVMNNGKIIQTGSPFEVYNNPISEFVLKFFNPQYLNKLTTDQLMSIKRNVTYNLQLDYKQNDNIFIRPQDITLTSGDDYFITEVTLQGARQIAKVSRNELELYVSLSANIECKIGSKCNININKVFAFT